MENSMKVVTETLSRLRNRQEVTHNRLLRPRPMMNSAGNRLRRVCACVFDAKPLHLTVLRVRNVAGFRHFSAMFLYTSIRENYSKSSLLCQARHFPLLSSQKARSCSLAERAKPRRLEPSAGCPADMHSPQPSPKFGRGRKAVVCEAHSAERHPATEFSPFCLLYRNDGTRYNRYSS